MIWFMCLFDMLFSTTLCAFFASSVICIVLNTHAHVSQADITYELIVTQHRHHAFEIAQSRDDLDAFDALVVLGTYIARFPYSWPCVP